MAKAKANFATAAPWGLKWRSSTFFIIATVAIGLFTDLFLYGLIVPVLPFLLRDRLAIPPSAIQTSTSILLACYAGSAVLFSLPAGILADRISTRQLPFLVGLVALLASTVLFATGQSMTIFIVARVIQGISAAVVWCVGMALVMDTVGSDKLGVTLGSIFSFISVGELLAPVLGGVVYKKAGANAVFAMGFALLALDFLMRIVLIEKKVAATYVVPEDSSQEDIEENIQSTEHTGNTSRDSETTPLLAKPSSSSEDNGGNNDSDEDDTSSYHFTHPPPSWMRSFPIIYTLSDPRLLTAFCMSFLHALLLAVFDATIPTEAQSLFGVDSLRAGLLFIPLVLPYLLLGPLAGRWVDQAGPKPAAVAGLAYMAIPLVLLQIPHAESESRGHAQMAIFGAMLALNGFGLAFIAAPYLVEASQVLEKYHAANTDFFGQRGPYAQLYALSSIFFYGGLTVGPLVAGSLRESIGYGNMNACVAGACAIMSLLCWVYLGGKPTVLKRRQARG